MRTIGVAVRACQRGQPESTARRGAGLALDRVWALVCAWRHRLSIPSHVIDGPPYPGNASGSGAARRRCRETTVTTTYVIVFQVRPGRDEAFLGLLEGVLDAMRGEESFRNAILHRDPADPARFLLYETWADHQEVLDVQLHRDYRQAYEAALPDLLAEPRQIGIWQPPRADGDWASPKSCECKR